MGHLCIKYIAFMALIVVDGLKVKPAIIPTLTRNPFSAFWNIHSEPCWRQFNVSFYLNRFSIVANTHETLNGAIVTWFDFNTLGSFPYIDNAGNSINGGVPQNGDLSQHLHKTESDIRRIITEKMFRGLGVIGWKSWRPLWIRNVDDKIIYKNRSIDIIQNRHPTWSLPQILETAEKEFNDGARNFFNNTLFLAKVTKSHGWWGFYSFPECLNYPTIGQNYTGECAWPSEKLNDQLHWLWEQSTVLYPSISLPDTLRANPKILDFVKYRIREALRVASLSKQIHDLPVYAYLKITYVNANAPTFLLEEDIVRTIGESASLGAAGVILSGDASLSGTRAVCEVLENYITGSLGKYLINVTTAANYCSDRICTGNGRCVRRYFKKKAFLHLPSPDFKISVRSSPYGKRVHVTGTLQNYVLRQWNNMFRCQCYKGWMGFSCEIACFQN